MPAGLNISEVLITPWDASIMSMESIPLWNFDQPKNEHKKTIQNYSNTQPLEYLMSASHMPGSDLVEPCAVISSWYNVKCRYCCLLLNKKLNNLFKNSTMSLTSDENIDKLYHQPFLSCGGFETKLLLDDLRDLNGHQVLVAFHEQYMYWTCILSRVHIFVVSYTADAFFGKRMLNLFFVTLNNLLRIFVSFSHYYELYELYELYGHVEFHQKPG